MIQNFKSHVSTLTQVWVPFAYRASCVTLAACESNSMHDLSQREGEREKARDNTGFRGLPTVTLVRSTEGKQ